jgi:hypothetical protein
MLSSVLKTFVVAIFVWGAAFALALPTPKDIEAAVAAGQYAQAESMLREVLQDKPQSAKAHYELGQVLAHLQRYKEAQIALQKAKDIDATLKFAASPEKFNTVFAKVSDLAAAPSSAVVMAPAVAPVTQAVPKSQPAQEAVTGFFASSMSYVWLGIAGLVVLGLWLRRSAAQATNQNDKAVYAPSAASMGMPMPAGSPVSTANTPRGFGANFSPSAQPGGYAPQGYGPQGYAQPNRGGSSMTGAVVGGLAGVAAGYALSKALEGDHHAAPPASAEAAPSAGQNGYVPFDTPAQHDLGAFDAGSGNDWDSADSGGGDDSW